jgi:uncharacterized membrane protein
VALAAVLIGSQWFPEYVRADIKDFIGLWSLIAAAAVIFAVKAACASVLLGATLMSLIESIALHEKVHIHSLFQIVFDAITSHGSEAYVTVCMAVTLVYAVFSTVATVSASGYHAAIDSVTTFVDR